MISRRGFLVGLPPFALVGCSAPEAREEVMRQPLRESGLVGTLFLPRHPERAPAVLCLTGAGGGLWEEPAAALAAAGFPALALATHNFPGLPPALRKLPIDTVERAVEWLKTQAKPKGDFVAVRGWSRGGELALILASLSSSVNAVVAYSPRCYVGLEHGKPNNFSDGEAAPAWTYRGAPVAATPLPQDMLVDRAHQTFEDIYGIAVERIRGPILLISGEADTGLAGTTATFGCNAVMRRLDLFDFKYRHEHLSYRDAGHNIAGPPPFRQPPENGGTMEGNIAAVADSWPRSLAFLRAAAE
jgi:dienelactone hydrolase